MEETKRFLPHQLLAETPGFAVYDALALLAANLDCGRQVDISKLFLIGFHHLVEQLFPAVTAQF
jgi:hypothetical protein